VTDGERILGLGDWAYKAWVSLSGRDPSGDDAPHHLGYKDYIGLRHARVTGQEYDAFIDEFMEAVVHRYGQNTLIQFEDFGNHNAFRFMEKYRNLYCTFNDDIQGTASVAVAGIFASLRKTNTQLKDHTFLFQGAGEAAIGIANLLVMAMGIEEDISEEDAIKKIWLKDSRGLIVKGRPEGGISKQKERFAQDHSPMNDLAEIVKELKPTVLIGAAAVPGVFTEAIIKDMATFNKEPVIFALSNPTAKAECTAAEAYTHSEGRAVFASGSPFPTFQMNGQTYEPGQGNNAYIFPGLPWVSSLVFLSAAQALSETVTAEDLAVGRVYPSLSKIKETSLKIAHKIAENAYVNDMASFYPKPKDLLQFISEQLYDYDYDSKSSLPLSYSWPKEAQNEF
ncbi:Malic enzyme, partial [Caligus rogercresseyi]